MTSSEIASLTIAKVRQGLADREFSAVELAQEALRFAQAENPKTNAYLHFCPERALAAARRVDETLGRGEDAGVLAGVPVAVKDVILTEGVLTICGSKLLANYVAPYDATAVIGLEAAGGVILGKTNCDEFAMGSSTEHSSFGIARNPWNRDCIPGGSSGGSAVQTTSRKGALAERCMLTLASSANRICATSHSCCSISQETRLVNGYAAACARLYPRPVPVS